MTDTNGELTLRRREQIIADKKEMMADGAAIDKHGNVNTKRFSRGPVPELVLSWWNKTTTCEVRREATDHRVIVVYSTEMQWVWHIIISTLICVLLLGIFVLGVGVPMVYTVVLGVVYVLVILGLIMFERYVVGSTTTYSDPIVMDSVLWEGVKEVAVQNMDKLPRRQEAKFKQALAKYKAEYKIAAQTAKKQGREVPEFDPPQKENFVTSSKGAHMMDDVFVEFQRGLEVGNIAQYHKDLYEVYAGDTDLLLSMGEGVRGCQCMACQYCHDHDITPTMTGIEAARRREDTRIIATEYALDWRREIGLTPKNGSSEHDEKAKKKAAAAVKAYDDKRAAQREAEAEAQRREEAKDRVAALRGAKKARIKELKARRKG